MSSRDDLSSTQLCDLIEHWTGANPSTEPVFALATDQECQRCRRIQPSIMVSLDGEKFERLCGACLNHAPL